jgi:hypothetical protein
LSLAYAFTDLSPTSLLCTIPQSNSPQKLMPSASGSETNLHDRLNQSLSPSSFLRRIPASCTPGNQFGRPLMNCSSCGFNLVSCRLKSSTVPILKMLMPGKSVETRYINVPQVSHQKFVMFACVATVLLWPQVLRFDCPLVR